MKVQSSVIDPEKDREMKALATGDLEAASKVFFFKKNNLMMWKELDTYIKPPKEGDRLKRRIKEKLPMDSFERADEMKNRLLEKFDYFDDDPEVIDEIVKEDIFRRRELQEEIALQFLSFLLYSLINKIS